MNDGFSLKPGRLYTNVIDFYFVGLPSCIIERGSFLLHINTTKVVVGFNTLLYSVSFLYQEKIVYWTISNINYFTEKQLKEI